MAYKHENPKVYETFIRVTMLDDGGALIEDVTYGMVHEGNLHFYDVQFYERELASYHEIKGKHHTYFVYGCEPDLAKKIAILYHAKRGKLPIVDFS